MWLGSLAGNGLQLSATGCRFPLATRLREHDSWHITQGRVVTPRGTWEFGWQPLPCEESLALVAWLRQVAGAIEERRRDGVRTPFPLRPRSSGLNLRFDVVKIHTPAEVTVRVGLDVESRPVTRNVQGSGLPSALELETSPTQLRTAAVEWSANLARFPSFVSSC